MSNPDPIQEIAQNIIRVSQEMQKHIEECQRIIREMQGGGK